MTVSIPVTRPSVLNNTELRTLRIVVGTMIPASTEYEVPGADDDLIFADIAASIGRDEAAVRVALAELDRLAGESLAGASLADVPQAAQDEAIARFRETRAALVPVLVALTTRCYYRDDRVMRAIGMEVRPPFPKGFTVDPGDWSLLDPVRARGPIWRKA